MAPRKKADWQREARVWKDVSPQELKYEQRSRESNLEANAAARAKLAQRGKEPELNVPDEVVEWFDRSRVAYLFALEQRQGKTKAGSPDDAIAKFHESYVKQKFERRGQFLWSVFHKVSLLARRACMRARVLSLRAHVTTGSVLSHRCFRPSGRKTTTMTWGLACSGRSSRSSLCRARQAAALMERCFRRCRS
jgi:hypothetical protein